MSEAHRLVVHDIWTGEETVLSPMQRVLFGPLAVSVTNGVLEVRTRDYGANIAVIPQVSNVILVRSLPR